MVSDVNQHIFKEFLVALRADNIIDRYVTKTRISKVTRGAAGSKVGPNIRSRVFLALKIGGADFYNNYLPHQLVLYLQPACLVKIRGAYYNIISYLDIEPVLRVGPGFVKNSYHNVSTIKTSNEMPLYIDHTLLYDLRSSIEAASAELIRSAGTADIKSLSDILNLNKYIRLDGVEPRVKTFISKNLRLAYQLYILENKFFGTPLLYLPSFIDNRSRKYVGSGFSPTFYSLLRKFFYIKATRSDITKSVYYHKIIAYEYALSEYTAYLEAKSRLRCSSGEFTFFILIILMHIGIMLKHEIPHKGGLITTEAFIKRGVAACSAEPELSSLDDLAEFKRLKRMLLQYMQNYSLPEHTMLFKDATASGLQNFGQMLGIRPGLHYTLNMCGDGWCDTYSYIINKYLGFEDIS